MKNKKSHIQGKKSGGMGQKLKLFLENRQLKGYNRISTFGPTKHFVWNIRKVYEIMKPASEKVIILNTMKVVELCFLAVLSLMIYVITIQGASIYTYLIMFSLFFIVTEQIVSGSLWKEDYKLLTQLEKYLGDIRHYYHIGGMVEEAIYDSLEEAPYEISLHMQKIYDVLTVEEEEAEKYKEIAPNKFFKAFVALCQITMEYGDTVREDKSLFLTNLNYLRNEIHVEILKRDKIKYTFSGLVMVTILPVFFLKAIEDWSISNLPELGKYYHGQYGILVSIAIFLATIFAYVLICSLKEEKKIIKTEHRFLQWAVQVPWIKRQLEKYFFHHPGKVYSLDQLLKSTGKEMTVGEFLVQKVFLFVGTVLVSLLIFTNIIVTERYNTIYDVSDFNGVTLVNQEEEIDSYRRIISAGADYFKEEEDVSLLEAKIKDILENSEKVTGETAIEVLGEEILARVLKYQQTRFHWYYWILSIFAGVVICHGPLLILEIKRYFLKSMMEDEVMQFQTMIVMLMYIPRMNVEIILEWMESFGEVFKQSIMECVDMYSFDDERALQELKEKEPFPSFVRIVEDLQACDNVGIEAAFDEIASQRAYFSEKRKQDNEIQISNKGVIGKVAAYVPMALVIGLYLIVPFVLESLSQLNGYMIQMEIF